MELLITSGEAVNPSIDFADFSNHKVKKINRKHVVDGSFVFKVGLTNEHNCSVLLFKKQGGEKRKTSYKIIIKNPRNYKNNHNNAIIYKMSIYTLNWLLTI